MKTKNKDKKKKINNKKRKSKKKKLSRILFGTKNKYTFSEVFVITILSLLIGIFTAFSILTIFTHGRNVFRMSKDLGKFYDAYQVLIDNYYGDINKEELIDAGILGMTNSVGDTYTNYVDENATSAFDELVSGTYEGIGCTIMKDNDVIKVVEVYEGGPASKANIKSGDIIKRVDKIDASKSNINTISSYIRYEARGEIEMVIVRDEKEQTIKLVRGKVEIPTVSSKIIENNNKKIGYIKLSLFSSVSAEQFKKELTKLEKSNISGLIVDVRDNNGGYLSSVTDIVSEILPKGEAIYQVQKNKNKKIIKDKTSEKRDYSIAVLVNERSASASEIFAAAIKESYNGYVVGVTTYGKGTVQQIKKLSDGSMIKYTIENWLTPKGNWIDGEGVEPTEVVKLDEKYYSDPNDDNDNQFKKALELVSK